MKKYGRLLCLLCILSLALFCFAGCAADETESESPTVSNEATDTPEEQTPEANTEGWKPEQTVEIIVPVSPGGSTDMLARAVEAVWSKYCDQPVLITNMSGGGGVNGAMAVASAEPDGYTLEIGYGSGHDLSMPYLQELEYDPFEMLDPICLLSEHVIMIGVPADSEFDSMADIVAWAEETGEPITASVSTANGTADLTCQAIAYYTGLNLNIVPHDGTAGAVTDLLSGSYMICGATPSDFLPYVQSGQIKVLAVASAERDPSMPDVPTLIEEGIDFSAYGSIKGIAGPKGMPDEIKAYYEQLFAEITSDETFIETMQDLGQPVMYMGTEEFTQYFSDANAFYKQLIEDLGLAHYA